MAPAVGGSPWLPKGFGFLSGLPESPRRRRTIVPIQVFVDESGGRGTTKVLSMVGLLAELESWAEFSERWSECLAQSPAIPIFKMREASGRTGWFRGWSDDAREKKLRSLARIINDHVECALWTVTHLDAFDVIFRREDQPKPMDDPYFWAYHTMCMAVAHELVDQGQRQRCEMIFDEQVISGLRAKRLYPFVRMVMEQEQPDAAAVMPVEPMFKTDDEFLPLQAADMFAWSIRRLHTGLAPGPCDFVFEEFGGVRPSENSQILDAERMERQMEMAEEYVVRHDPELLVKLREAMGGSGTV